MLGVSRWEANISILITHELAFIDGTICTWTARIVRQDETLPLLGNPTNGDVKRAEKMTPVSVKGEDCKSFYKSSAIIV